MSGRGFVRHRSLAGLIAPFVAAAVVALVPCTPVAAQGRLRSNEVRQLREAANLESRGDFDGAARVLREVLAEDPASSGALFALERVLRAKGRTPELLPVLDTFLAREPSAAGVRYLKLRVLTDVDSLDAMQREAEAWLDADPTNEGSYREIARVYERAYGEPEALALLRRGREAIDRPDALALEMGDIHAALGERDEAVDEWARAVGDDGAQTVTIIRRIQGLPDGVDLAGRRLVERVSATDDVARRRAGARIALDLGLEEDALRLSRDVADDLDGRARETFLGDVARRAREQDLVSVAAWAYDELGEVASSPEDRRQFDLRIVEIALETGDTAAALDAQRRVADSYSAGSVDRRRATAEIIRLEGASADPQRLRRLLADFRRDFPNAPELDDLAATVASALNGRGDTAGAATVLEGVDGPRSSLETGYLLLENGDIQEGRGSLLLAVTGLPPAQATAVIQFASLFDRVSPEGASLLASAGAQAHRGQGRDAALDVADAVDGLAERDRAPLLAEAARMAARGGADDVAAEIHATLVSDYASSSEVGEAALALARYRARQPGGVPEAIRLLEDLITERPNAAVVPDARLELQRLRAGQR